MKSSQRELVICSGGDGGGGSGNARFAQIMEPGSRLNKFMLFRTPPPPKKKIKIKEERTLEQLVVLHL